LYGDDAIEAAVSTKTPEPYTAFLGAHEGDWTGARKEDPTENTVADGETLVRFWMPASDPAAADLVIGFFEAGDKCHLTWSRNGDAARLNN